MNIEQVNIVLIKAISGLQESEIEGMVEARKKSAKRIEMEKILADYYKKRGTVKLPGFDKKEYPPMKGMEGPFQFRDGRILYYDPKKGRYYDRKTDMYLARNDIPEHVECSCDELEEAKFKVPAPKMRKKKGCSYRNSDGDFTTFDDCVDHMTKCKGMKEGDAKGLCGGSMFGGKKKKTEESLMIEAKGPKWVKDKDSHYDGIKAVGKLIVARVDKPGHLWRWSVEPKHVDQYGGQSHMIDGQAETKEAAQAMAMKVAPKLHVKLAKMRNDR